MSFSLATIRDGGPPTAIVTVDGRHYRIADVAPSVLADDPRGGLLTVLRRWADNEPVLVEAADRLARDPTEHPEVAPPPRLEDWLTPLQYPSKVICTGYNYRAHVTGDAGRDDFVKEDNIPVFFLRPPTTTLVGQGRSVRYPIQSTQLDYEIELAVVIGRRGRRIGLEHAMDYVAGYTIGIDLSARDWQRHPKHMAKFDVFGGKAFDDSCPIGPAIVPARFVDAQNLQLQFRLNGTVRQDASTSDMIWSIPEQIALISEHVTLEPGDVIMTGTPSGVGLTTGTWLAVGDHLEGRITGLAALRVEIIEDGARGRQGAMRT
jgi:2-keto-4-pentenoate hydratase/2-oxohepta-3-ene-1,7-dioic acid hydratase in catechol pathway